MDIFSSLAIITLSAIIHASFQLSVSVLMLLSGHSLGKKQTNIKIMRRTTSFVIGASIMTLLLLSSTSTLLLGIFGYNTPQIVWSIVCGLSVGVAVSIWLFYYKHEKGTTIWIPRGIANYLNQRTKLTDSSAEAFGLGLSSVIAEILFIIAPLLMSALVLVQLSPEWQLLGLFVYVIVSMLPLIFVWSLVGGGHSLGKIQKWREDNKHFLQFIAGTGLIVLAGFVYVNEILCNISGVL
ncbi:MAG TPA: hypothetical protein PLO25_01345 [Candidatus Saccharibacteria bacterium]|nr:hypothetical protein [Candidatus Saccharibacteria bacterium]